MAQCEGFKVKMQPTRRIAASCLIFLNFYLYIAIIGISGWAINKAIDHSFIIESNMPEHFSPIHFPMGNAATGFLVIFALIGGVVGLMSNYLGRNHVTLWDKTSLPSASTAAYISWGLIVLAMGFACKEIEQGGPRHAALRAMEAILIILTVTQGEFILFIRDVAQYS